MNAEQIRLATLSLAVLSVSWTAAEAQTTPRFALSVDAGISRGESKTHLEDVLRAAGLDDVNPYGGGWAGEDKLAHPYSDRSFEWGADVRVRVRPRISLGLNVAASNVGSTYGYSNASGLLNPLHFTAEYSVETVAPVVTWHPLRRLRVGGGPARHKLKFASPEGAGIRVRENTWGFVGQGGLMFWQGESMFSEIVAQYRGMGSLALPDVTLVANNPFGPPSAAVIPGNAVPYRNWSIGLSLGMRLY